MNVKINSKVVYVLIVLIAVVLSIGVVAQSQPKESSAILFDNSKLTILPGVYMNVLDVTNNSITLNFASSTYNNTTTLYDGNMYVSPEGNFSLLVRGFFSFRGRYGMKNAAIVTQIIQQKTSPWYSKLVYSSFIPVKPPTTTIPTQWVAPIPTSKQNLNLPKVMDNIDINKLISSNGYQILFGLSTLSDKYTVLSESNPPSRVVEWTYGGDYTGYIKFRDLEGYIVHYTGYINNKQQDLYVILQINKPTFVIDMPSRQYVFEVHLEPDNANNMYKMIMRCIGWNCRRLE